MHEQPVETSRRASVGRRQTGEPLMNGSCIRDVVVAAGGPTQPDMDCQITCLTLAPHARYAMVAALPDRAPIEVEAGDCFEALRRIRTQLEIDGIRLRCAGARRDVWSSGMQRDMGMGLQAYVLTFPRTADRPEVVDIFAPAPAELVGTVAEQEQFFRAWTDSPRR